MRLKKFQINSGGKFNPDTTGPVVIDFSKSKIVTGIGDEASGKSTLLELFLMACGQNGGKDIVEALKNKDNEKIDLDLEFVGNDKANYEVKIKDGKITVKKEGEVQRSGEVGLLKQQLGVVGVSPMALKTAPVKDIVKWLATYSNRGAEEFEKEMLKIKNGIKEAKKTRAAANNNAKGSREFLAIEGYMDSKNNIIEKKWKESEAQYKKKVDIAEVSGRLDKASADADKYLRAEEKLKNHKAARPADVKKVEDLKAELKLAEAALVQRDKDIAAAEKYLFDNKKDKTNYDAVKDEFENVSKDAVAYDKWQEVQKKKKEMDGYEDISQKADALEKKLLKDQQELQWEVIPDIAGLEIVLEDTHEDEGEQKKEGFYIKGMNSVQMSNTEFLTAIFKILKKNNVPVIVVDDASQFGSSLMSTLDSLAKGGCFILMTEMKRGQQELEIDYK